MVTEAGLKPSNAPDAQDPDVVMNDSSTTAPGDDTMGTSGTKDNLNTKVTSQHDDARGIPMQVDPSQTSQTSGASGQYGTGIDGPDSTPPLLPTGLEGISMTANAMDIEDDRISYVSNDEPTTNPTTSSITTPASAMNQSKPSQHAAFLAPPLSLFVTAQPYGSSPYADRPISAPANDDTTSSNSQPIKLDANSMPTISVASPSHSADVKTDTGVPMGVDQDQVRKSENQGGEDHRQDLLPKVKGLFRLLDLYSEQGSGGLVDKIIIAQDSLKSLIDTLSPGAYSSITKINFAALDRVQIKATGLYGSKSEIVRLLREADAVDDETADLLLLSDDDRRAAQLSLRSGIYLFLPSAGMLGLDCGFTPTVHIIYWPEDTTWDDTASGGVKRNRVTFMRYLTRLTDQIRILASPEHASSLIWKEDDSDSDSENEKDSTDETDSEDEDDRFFKFEVAKTHEQEENAQVHDGFVFKHQAIGSLAYQQESSNRPNQETIPPTLLAGETRQGFMTAAILPGKDERREINGTFSRVRLASTLKDKRIYLEQSINEDALAILMSEGELSSRAPDLHRAHREAMETLARNSTAEAHAQKERISNEIKSNRGLLEEGLRRKIAVAIQESYPVLELATTDEADSSLPNEGSRYLANLYGMFSEVRSVCDKVWLGTDLKWINARDYKRIKQRFLYVRAIIEKQGDKLQDNQRENLVRSILTEDDPVDGSKSGGVLQSTRGMFKTLVSAIIGTSDEEKMDKDIQQCVKTGLSKPDPEFLRSVEEIIANDPSLTVAAQALITRAREWADKKISELSGSLLPKVESAQLRSIEEQVRLQLKNQETENQKSAIQHLRESLNVHLAPQGSTPDLILSTVRKCSGYHSYEFTVIGHSTFRVESVARYRIWPMELTESDSVALRDNPQHVPRPRARYQPVEFTLPMDHRVRHVQLLRDNHYLVVADSPGGTRIWLQSEARPFGLKAAKQLQLPRQYVMAVDENKRLVSFVCMDNGRCTLNVFVMDEELKNLSGRGTPFDVAQWYTDGPAQIQLAVFFSGTEELCLIEKSGRARIYSFLSQGFRPASIQLPASIEFAQAAPDASALLVVERTAEGSKQIRVYHRASFGNGKSPHGIVRDLPAHFSLGTQFAVTSLGQQNVSLLALLPDIPAIGSVSLEISRKETEYQFREREQRDSSPKMVATKHNSLLNCFSEVWARYPVVPAIKRETISADGRLDAVVTLVTDHPTHQFSRYFKGMIREFEKLSRKPTDRRLDSIQLESLSFSNIDWDGGSSSVFRAGEWLVELLCLIPIHIAIARENRFVPLKDGVFDLRLEQQLLGAEVSKIIDTLSLGWYESIFGSYLAAKEVKVISSMGEQSVGKSYSLNHIVDSSFAGSAVRTTEGVWLSVCPSKNILVVALDFEGVHSIERTAQEDMLLVLFNTALSNLIIFRNNFALSRDVANMFTSFQASTHIFDPASNPRLFKGCLAVVIKDVVDGDKKEIVQEFKMKFSQIVGQEQANNFITKLHDGQLTVIPWNVIESREFYTLFSKLSKQLFKQKTTHTTAGEFLMTLKTLMAKLKAQDWGAMDRELCRPYPSNKAIGDHETTQNFDSQEVILSSDSQVVFYLGKSLKERQDGLQQLLVSWRPEPARNDMAELKQHLQTIVEARVMHVHSWLASNISRFQADNADIRALKREHEELSESLRANAQPCFAECSSCRLPCLLIKSHESQDHDCNTSHECLEICEFPNDHDSEDPEDCSLPAGHGGRHICASTEHVCGLPCHLIGRRGCQQRCTKSIDHEDEGHACSARTHQCGEPCSLRDVPTFSGSLYSCNGLCTRSFDEEHDQHSCDNRMSCPIQCELCQRFCALGDHFHGLDGSVTPIHLCGQEHSCNHDCELPGICRVNPTPHKVETLFVGQHESFQFTKYTQEAERLACAVTIKSKERDHLGPHVHSTAADPFHFCETDCQNCGYICRLPYGHPQAEHETGHGSMENTSWAIEGAADVFVEVQGRKYGARDGGAPQLCSSVCSDLGRHAHIDYCRNVKGGCQELESEHIAVPMLPDSSRPKDWVSHKVFWARSGFKDPYSPNDQAEFAKCDARCAGPEHEATANAPARPSYCTLRIFHPPQPLNWTGGNASYVSTDGHSFPCPNPNSLRQAFHVIFVLDRSGSMYGTDRKPVANTPSSAKIMQYNSNRLGAVYSAVYGFWMSRSSGLAGPRRDSYSVILFDSCPQTFITNDTTSTPDQLLDRIVSAKPTGGTHFDAALKSAQTLMEAHWSTDRSPVVIFLSDGECGLNDNVVHDICQRAVALQKPLSLHAVSFGSPSSSSSLRRMVTIAEQVSQNAPNRDPLAPLVPCGYTDALDTVRLAETFLNIADSLKKPRASLIHT
ncbi:hypothetical protein FRB93_006355 [Tulasnella sp. JGI-2019a]|nr:hypothetical protein FRB93_006355 [Tulasnella sp. JGI-2019a]